jgi:hypothetical protein
MNRFWVLSYVVNTENIFVSLYLCRLLIRDMKMGTEIWLLLNCSFMTPTKQNKIGHLKIKNCKFQSVENFKYWGVIFSEDNNHQIDLQERIKNANKTYFRIQNFFKNKNVSKKLKNTTIDETWILRKTDRNQMNIF